MESGEYAALKLITGEALERHGIEEVENEILIMNRLKGHKNIIGLKSYGTDGYVIKKSGKRITNLIYILMEYGWDNLYDVVDRVKGVGEDAGRIFFIQILDAIEYMHKKKVVHRDIKLENIVVDQDMNIKFCDFGFSTYKSIKKLYDYLGTKSYMAPEIHAGQYDGI